MIVMRFIFNKLFMHLFEALLFIVSFKSIWEHIVSHCFTYDQASPSLWLKKMRYAFCQWLKTTSEVYYIWGKNKVKGAFVGRWGKLLIIINFQSYCQCFGFIFIDVMFSPFEKVRWKLICFYKWGLILCYIHFYQVNTLWADICHV